MSDRRFRRPSARAVLALAVLVFGGALAPAVDATSAWHLRLTRSSPSDGATLSAPPAEIRLWFSQTPEHAVSMIRLEGPAGAVALGDVSAGEEDSLWATVEETLAAGAYTVHWRTSSGDGHPIRGTFAFTVPAG